MNIVIKIAEADILIKMNRIEVQPFAACGQQQDG
jgi:hypothetical protein